jgi:cell division protease FtsH
MQVPEEEKYLMSKDEILSRITTLYGGRAAEELVFGSITTGASNDIEKATGLARAMVTQYGMSEKFGLMGLESIESRYLDGRPVQNCSNETAGEIDKEVMRILKECYDRALKLLAENREVLDRIAEYLITKETITGEEFRRIYKEIKGEDLAESNPEASKDSEGSDKGADPDKVQKESKADEVISEDKASESKVSEDKASENMVSEGVIEGDRAPVDKVSE